MPQCGSQAHLLVTLTAEGTLTNIVRRRIELRCTLEEGHLGLHRDENNKEEWETIEGRPSTVLRHED
ncbi:MAG TPA: hypothetical protein VF881_02305 [Polyangiaceae bacterium]